MNFASSFFLDNLFPKFSSIVNFIVQQNFK